MQHTFAEHSCVVYATFNWAIKEMLKPKTILHTACQTTRFFFKSLIFRTIRCTSSLIVQTVTAHMPTVANLLKSPTGISSRVLCTAIDRILCLPGQQNKTIRTINKHRYIIDDAVGFSRDSLHVELVTVRHESIVYLAISCREINLGNT